MFKQNTTNFSAGQANSRLYFKEYVLEYVLGKKITEEDLEALNKTELSKLAKLYVKDSAYK